MRTGIVIQARMSSTRLPGKVLLPLPFGGKTTVLEQVLRRARKARRADEVVLATTTGQEDEPLVRLARRLKVPCFCGSRDDVLGRYHGAAVQRRLDTVVRVTSDCPCIDPGIIDAVIEKHERGRFDYTRNVLFARGLDVEACSFKALDTAFRDARAPQEREHVTVYLRESRPDRFRIGALRASGLLRRPGLRLALDTREDYLQLCAIYGFLYAKDPLFGAADVSRLLQSHPWIALVNDKTYQKEALHSKAQELREARKLLLLHGFKRAAHALRRG